MKEYKGSLDDVIEIIQTEAGITCSKDKKPVLATYGLRPCIVIMGYEPNLKIGFLAHIDELIDNVSQTLVGNLERIPKNQNYELSLIGGDNITDKKQVQKIIDSFTINNLNPHVKFKIINNKLYENSLQSKSLALDTRTGNIYSYDAMKAGENDSIKKQRRIYNKKLPLIAMSNGHHTCSLSISYFPKA